MARTKSPVKLKKKAKKPAKRKPKLTNHICFILDRSSSMNYLRNEVIENFNKQAGEIRTNAKNAKQETTVSLYTFSTDVDEPVFFTEDITELGDLTREGYAPYGWTALRDGVGTAIEDLQKVSGAKNKNTSFLLIVMTDGEENHSRRFSNAKLTKMLREVQSTDRWTVVFMGPQGAEGRLTQLGIHKGNIQEWDGSLEEFTRTSKMVTQGVGNYFTARSSGLRSTSTFFTPDMGNVNRDKLRKGFKNEKRNFNVWEVQKRDPLTIRDFVEKRNKGKFKTGASFYELTKKETVQAYKEFAIVENSTGYIYTGGDARNLLKLPTGGEIKLNPSFDKRYSIYVSSTSVNRKLVVGTKLLYSKKK